MYRVQILFSMHVISYLTAKDFDCVSDYIITEKPCGRIVTLTANNHTIMGYPMCIEHNRYPRNKYLFNISFVFLDGVDPYCYRSALEHLAETLYHLGKGNFVAMISMRELISIQ